MRRLVLAAMIAVGCGGGSVEPTAFGVNVTVDAHAIAGADLAKITTATLTVTGAEQYTKSFDISMPIKTGEVRFRYVPLVQSGTLTLALSATDAAGDEVADGVSEPVVLVPRKAVDTEIPIGAVVFDMSQPSDMTQLDAGEDAGMSPPDLSVVKLNCMGMARCVYDCINGGTDLNTCMTQCSPKAKPGSANKWTTAVLCGQNYCVADADMMTGKCVFVSMTGNPNSILLCDPGATYAQCSSPTYVSTVCGPCLDQARNIWIFDSSMNPMGPPTGKCSMPTSADCMGAEAACMTEFSACLNDP